jgi:hypothetical protein
VLGEGKSPGSARHVAAFFSKYKIAQKMSYRSHLLGAVFFLEPLNLRVVIGKSEAQRYRDSVASVRKLMETRSTTTESDLETARAAGFSA